jgi:hypothetical protein
MVIRWSIDGKAETYAWQHEQLTPNGHLEIEEQRADPGGAVRRTIVRTGQRPLRAAHRFKPGPAFVASPVESIIEGWVARGEAEQACVSMSSRQGQGTHTVLLRRLEPTRDEPDGPRLYRVLAQDDYAPAGVVLTFDDNQAAIVREASARYTLERITADEP